MIASHTEIFLLKSFAPKLLSKTGKIWTALVFVTLISVAAYGWTQVEVDYSFQYHLTRESFPPTNFYRVANKYGKVPYYDEIVMVFTNQTGFNLYSEENQLKMIELTDNLYRCRDCFKPWVKTDSLEMWHEEYRIWLDQGKCSLFPKDGLDPFYKAIDMLIFKACLNEWTKNDTLGKSYRLDMVDWFCPEMECMHGFRFKMKIKKLKGLASEGIDMLDDFRRIEGKYGIDQTFSKNENYYSIEIQSVFITE